jgi:DNA-binding CsgD family transcriptional regulator
MNEERSGGGAVVAQGAAGVPTFARPAELVDISERIYRRVFGVGLWVAVGAAVFGMLSSLLQPSADQAIGVIVCGAALSAILLVVTVDPARCYGTLRRHPATLVIPAALLAAGALLIGPHNYQLLVLMAAVVGVMGIATPLWVVLVAVLVAGVGLGAPHVISHEGDVVGVVGVLVPPLMFWLIVDRIASFALRLHQTFSAQDATSSTHRRPDAGSPSSAPHAASPPAVERRALPAPSVIVVAGTRMTSRQLQVLLLACEGLRHAEIGACLGIGTQQVRRHLRGACQRTGSQTAAQLVAWARRTQLVPDARPA